MEYFSKEIPMNLNLKRREILKYAGIGGIVALSKITPLAFLESAFSEEVKEFKLNASITTVNVRNGL